MPKLTSNMSPSLKTVHNGDFSATICEDGTVHVMMADSTARLTAPIAELAMLSGLVHKVQDAWAKHKYDEGLGDGHV